MRILQVIPVFSDVFGGPVSVVRGISKELAKRHDVVVYTTTALDLEHDFNSREEDKDGYKVIYFSRALKQLSYSYLLGQLNFSPSMINTLKRDLKEFDIIHLHSWRQFPDIIVHHYAKKYGVPYVLQAHGSLPRIMAKHRLKWIFDVFFGYRELRDVSKVVALSQVEVQQYKDMGVSEDKINIIPNGIELAEYANMPPKGSFKKKFNIGDDEKTVLYLGRIHESKGLDLLAESFSITAKELDKVKLIVAGPDDGYLPSFSRLISDLGIKDKVLLTGFMEKSDKLAALVDSDLFVTPRFYGFPVTFLEACVARCPIVTSSSELDWIHGNVGYVVHNSPIPLAKAISSILQDERISRMFKDNCRTVIKNFDISVVTSQLEDMYKSVIGMVA